MPGITPRPSLQEYCATHDLSTKLTKAVDDCYMAQAENCSAHLANFFRRDGVGGVIEKVDVQKCLGKRLHTTWQVAVVVDGVPGVGVWCGEEDMNEFNISEALRGVPVADIDAVSTAMDTVQDVPEGVKFAVCYSALQTTAKTTRRTVFDMVSSYRTGKLDSLTTTSHDASIINRPKVVMWVAAGGNKSKIQLTFGVVVTSQPGIEFAKIINTAVDFYTRFPTESDDFEIGADNLWTSGTINSCDGVFERFKEIASGMDNQGVTVSWAVKGDSAVRYDGGRYTYDDVGSDIIGWFEGKGVSLVVDVFHPDDEKMSQAAVLRLYKGEKCEVAGFEPGGLKTHKITSTILPRPLHTIQRLVTDVTSRRAATSRPLIAQDYPSLALGLGVDYITAAPSESTWDELMEAAVMLDKHGRVAPQHTEVETMHVPGSIDAAVADTRRVSKAVKKK